MCVFLVHDAFWLTGAIYTPEWIYHECFMYVIFLRMSDGGGTTPQARRGPSDFGEGSPDSERDRTRGIGEGESGHGKGEARQWHGKRCGWPVRLLLSEKTHTMFYSHFTDQIWTIPHMTVKIAVIQLCGFTDKWILIEVHVSMWQLTGNN